MVLSERIDECIALSGGLCSDVLLTVIPPHPLKGTTLSLTHSHPPA
jgi:hypothetical protein